MKPKKIVRYWLKAFGHADAEAVSALYHDDAANHQVANEPIVGKAVIKAMFEAEFAAAEMVMIGRTSLRVARGLFWSGATVAAVAFSMWWMEKSNSSAGIGIRRRF